VATVFYADTNELATLTNVFKVSGTATDPTAISLTVTDPQGTATTYTYALAEITRSSAGTYTKDIPCTLAGIWHYKWVGTGTASDVVEGSWTVQPVGDQLYGSLEELKSRFAITDTVDDVELKRAMRAVNRGINNFCGRVFTRATTATARRIPNLAIGSPYGWGGCRVNVPDFWTTAGLVVETDTGNDGTFATARTDFELYPLDGIVDGETGWPYNEIEFYNGILYPPTNNRPYLRVTAKWGWAEVPEPVHEAFMILASDTFKLKDAPFGVGGYGQFGAVRVRENQMAAAKLSPFVRDLVLVA